MLIVNLNLFGIGNAATTSDYANMLKEGTYIIDCTIRKEYKCGNSDLKIEDKYLIAQNTKGDYVFEKNIYCPSAEHQYRYFKVIESGAGKYRCIINSKDKEISKKKIKLDRIKPGSKADLEIYNGMKDWANIDSDLLFSMLGGISQMANVLPNYTARLLNVRKETLNGILYDIEEYDILRPYAAKLKLYYLNGELVKSIKLLKGTLFSSSYFSDIKLLTEGYIVADIHRFDKNIEPEVFSVITKD